MLKFHSCCTHRVSWVLLPICFLAGVMNYLDRTNLAFAALELNADLGFTPVVRVVQRGHGGGGGAAERTQARGGSTGRKPCITVMWYVL